jgi:methylenetetrahydrofolate reductase (NADPH)
MHLPVDIGILPVINKKSVLQVCLLNGISIPQELSKIIGRYGDDSQEFKKAGIEYTIKQIESLKNLGIKSFHFFSGNNTKTMSEIVNATGLVNKS